MRGTGGGSASARARAAGAQGVRHLGDDGVDRLHGHVVVVAGDGVEHRALLAVLLGELRADQGMGTLRGLVHDLADVVEPGSEPQAFAPFGLLADGMGDLGSKVTLALDFDFSSKLLSSAFRRGFAHIADHMVNEFCQRADDVYGR